MFLKSNGKTLHLFVHEDSTELLEDNFVVTVQVV